MRRKLIAGNWKMNGSRDSIRGLLDTILSGLHDVPSSVDVAVCPPALYLQQVADSLKGTSVAWGGQDLSQHASGAYTGEISAAMLRDLGCSHVIIGHSERRQYHGESDSQVADKYLAAREVGLIPIVCVGETLEERESGVTNDVVARQIDAVSRAAGMVALAEAVIAYEPVWAIGTGKTASPEQAQEVHAFIRNRLVEQDAAAAQRVRILYGGSMKGGNAAELLAMPDIDGGLIGGAALQADEFLTICRAAG